MTPWATRLIIILIGFASIASFTYDPFSQWWNSLLHAQALSRLNEAVVIGPDYKYDKLREEAHKYNKDFLSTDNKKDLIKNVYPSMIDPTGNGVMGRIKIPTINVDLPIFHTSNDDVLRKGAGHMEETTLPVGGKATHAAITAHRGLATSKLFTDLDQVKIGDEFIVETLGEAFVYKVDTVRIVTPDETEWLVADPTRDLVTLITCDPLGINSHRMLVMGERIFPTPEWAEDEVGAESDQPGTPWWLIRAVIVGGVVVAVAIWATPNVKKKKTSSKGNSEPESVN